MRVNFEANESLVELIESLQEKTDSTKKGVIVGALLHLKWSLEQASRGRIIVAIDPEDLPERVHQYESAMTTPLTEERPGRSSWKDLEDEDANLKATLSKR
jgi:hypothetical protein